MKKIPFLTYIVMLFFVTACDKKDVNIENETMRLSVTPKWDGLNVDVRSEIGLDMDIFCWSWDKEQDILNTDFPRVQNSIRDKQYQFDLPKVNQKLIFTNINSLDNSDFTITQIDEYYYKVLRYDLTEKGYSDTEMVYGGLKTVDVTNETLTNANIMLFRGMTKVEVLLKINNVDGTTVSNASELINRMWFSAGPFCESLEIGRSDDYFLDDNYLNEINATRNAIPFTEIPMIINEKGETLYQVFEGYVFPRSYYHDVNIEFDFINSSKSLSLRWDEVMYDIKKGESRQVILDVPSYEFDK